MREPLNLITPNSICLEIGVWKGGFSKEILNKNPKQLHLIDPWKFQPSFGKKWYGGMIAKNQKDMDAIYNQVTSLFKSNSKVKIHRGFSTDLADMFEDKYFDWIYIDGNHEYEYVLQDLKSFLPKVKKGGYLTGDDYDWKNDAGELCVKKAVDIFTVENSLEISIHKNQFIIYAPK